MCFWIGKQQCGLNGLGCCGQGMETKIQNTSIVKQTKRYRRNLIVGIRDGQDRWHDQSDDIASILIDYYQDLFSSTRQQVSSGVLECIPNIINEEMNNMLCADFLESEVGAALHQMSPLKAPGLDGMPPLFFQHLWGSINNDVTSSILSWLNSGTLPSPLNHTFITLIPKTKSPEYVHQF